jgi:hypothetical protein
MDQQTLDNAMAAEATRADGPPDAREARRAELSKPGDAGIWSADPAKQRAAREELQQIMRSPEAIAAEQEAAAKIPASEKRRAELTRELTARDSKLTPEERAERTAELRKLLATDTEDPASANAEGVLQAGEDVNEWAETMRSRFGIEQPKLYTVERGADFDYHEGNALAFLAREGASPEVVQDIYRDFHEAIDNGTGVLDDTALDYLAKKYEGKLGAKAVATLRKWYVDEIRGRRGVSTYTPATLADYETHAHTPVVRYAVGAGGGAGVVRCSAP